MTLEEVYESLILKFTSSNEIPVTKATISQEEWKVIKINLLEGGFLEKD